MSYRILMAIVFFSFGIVASEGKSTQHTFFKNNYWETYGIPKNSDGIPMCGMQAVFSNAAFYVKWTPNGMGVMLWKANWKLSDGIKAPFLVEFFDKEKPDDLPTFNAKGATGKLQGVGSSIVAFVEGEDRSTFLQLFGDADKITVTFPQGDEPKWTLIMEGSRKAGEAFKQCIYMIQQIVAKPTQPANPTQPVKPQIQPVKSPKDDGGI